MASRWAVARRVRAWCECLDNTFFAAVVEPGVGGGNVAVEFFSRIEFLLVMP
ncbi:MAG TPA: hypothetical protein VIM96_11005 [Pseudomonadales bacterium]